MEYTIDHDTLKELTSSDKGRYADIVAGSVERYLGLTHLSSLRDNPDMDYIISFLEGAGVLAPKTDQ